MTVVHCGEPLIVFFTINNEGGPNMKSATMRECYADWYKQAEYKQAELVDAIYAECEANYDKGGDTIVECFSPDEVLNEFKSVQEAKEFCQLKVEIALNSRWGEDDDPEMDRYQRSREW